MLHLADDVFVATLAMRQDGAEIALGSGGHEQRGLEAQHRGDLVLQRIDAGIVAEHVVTQRRAGHGGTHAGSRLRHRIAAKVYGGGHGFCSRKFFSIAWPCSVRMDSGWNCTPWIGSSLWRTPMISPSSVHAVVTNSAGQDAFSIASE